jgi:hypothetical protein
VRRARPDCRKRRPAAAFFLWRPVMAKQNDAAILPALSAFLQSRIFAEGWNAARRTAQPARNPYACDPEGMLWLKGYCPEHLAAMLRELFDPIAVPVE